MHTTPYNVKKEDNEINKNKIEWGENDMKCISEYSSACSWINTLQRNKNSGK